MTFVEYNSKIRIVLKKTFFDEYILRKPNTRRKMKSLKQSRSPEKCEEGNPLSFLTSNKNEVGSIGDI